MSGGIILFDGVCNLCNSSVKFIIKRDPHAYFKFASLQGDVGQQLLQQYKITSIDSMILIENERYYIKTDAIFRICRQLRGWWKILYVGYYIPRPLRDFVYTIVAKNRYKWFGKQESCMIPTPELKQRFMDS